MQWFQLFFEEFRKEMRDHFAWIYDLKAQKGKNGDWSHVDDIFSMIHVQRTLKKEFVVVMLTVVPRDGSGKRKNESNFHANSLAIAALATQKVNKYKLCVMSTPWLSIFSAWKSWELWKFECGALSFYAAAPFSARALSSRSRHVGSPSSSQMTIQVHCVEMSPTDNLLL